MLTLIILSIFVCLLVLLSGTASARQLSVEKIIQNADIKTGDSVNISLEFHNPFNISIPITIQDNNVLGSNGLEIQCYEYTLPDKPGMILSYNFPITAFSEGDYTLDPASVTYTNPDTGAKETIKSQPLRISIKQGTTSGQQQGVTTIYNCKGVSMQSTSYSSGGSSISISSGQQQTNRQPQPQQPDNVQQTGSDMQNIKEEMERQQQDHQNMQNELKNRIENNSDFRKMKEELEKRGYSRQQEDIKPESNDTGSFKYDFSKGNESASISGNMNAGNMEDLSMQSTEEARKLQQLIESNQTFRQMQKMLSDKGYNQSGINITQKNNISTFDYEFSDPKGRNATISGNVSRVRVEDISLKEQQEPLPFWLLVFLILPLLGIYFYRKYRSNNAGDPVEVKIHIRPDPKEEALKRLETAVRMFNDGMQKEAYSEASNAVKLYFRGNMGVTTELTSEEILDFIKGSRDRTYLNDARECFKLCDLVKFAKYEPDLEDFNRAVDHAKKIII